MAEPSILIADDHPLYLRGIADFLHQIGYYDVITAKDGLTALQKIIDHKPDIAILDIEMPYLTGLEVAQKVREKRLPTKFIILSYQGDSMIIKMADKLNVSAYILKEDSMSELEQCIQIVWNGDRYFSPNIEGNNSRQHFSPVIEELTPTEKKILKLISEDMTSKTIADAYGVSIRTVEKHRSNIIEKLSLQASPSSLIIWAKENIQYL